MADRGEEFPVHQPDQYDGVAGNYERYRDLPTRRVHMANFVNLVGNVEGCDVLDLACGTGHFSRIAALGSARRVVGVDSSAEMVGLARKLSVGFENVEYLVQDVCELPLLGEFDVVTAELLLNYAPDGDALAAMCAAIARNLKPGGRFTATIPNSEYGSRPPHDTRYGLTVEWDADMADGTPYAFHVHADPPVDISCFYWSNSTCVDVLASVGLADLVITPLQPTPALVEEYGELFWRPWFENPWNVTIMGNRPELG